MSLGKKDIKFKDKGMVLLRKSFYLLLLVSKDDSYSPLGWDSVLLY